MTSTIDRPAAMPPAGSAAHQVAFPNRRTQRSAHDVGPGASTRWVILGLTAVFLGTPLVALVAFTMRGGKGEGLTLERWQAVFTEGLGAAGGPLREGIAASLTLSAVTVALMLALLVPAMISVRLHAPRLEKLLEFICLLPLTIPAVALVVGLVPVYRVISRMFGSDAWTLAFAYVILTLPYAYRAIQANMVAVDVVTLSQAARSLGASWTSVMWHVIIPNLRRGMLSAAFIAVAAVLGEFTIASLLGRTNVQTALVLVSKQDPYLSNIVVVIALAATLLLLFVIGRIGAYSRKARP